MGTFFFSAAEDLTGESEAVATELSLVADRGTSKLPSGCLSYQGLCRCLLKQVSEPYVTRPHREIVHRTWVWGRLDDVDVEA